MRITRSILLMSCLVLCACDGSTPSNDGGTDAGTMVDGAVDMPDSGLRETRVTTTGGEVIGVESGSVRTFRSIPYGAAPTGALRFARPQAHAGWSTPLDTRTTDPALACPQSNRMTGALSGVEDCLALNVFAPAAATDAPVMVFIHGGGFTAGAGTEAIYDGTRFAERGVVLIAINYRLGTLSFLVTPELVEADGGAGNLGLWDQRLALEWVRDNAAAFGGDPNNVTIFGESAGAVSVMMHMVSTDSSGLFARAIMESGGGGSGMPLQADRFAHYAPVVTALGCDSASDVLACLRDPALTVEDFIAANDAAGMSALGLPDVGPHVDGVFLTDQPRALVTAGATDVPFMLGSNADEATVFTQAIAVADEAAARSLLSTAYDTTTVDAILAIYDDTTFGTWKRAFDTFFGEVAFVCPALGLAAAGQDGEPVYTYRFTRGLPILPALGAFHGLELIYVFGHPDTNAAYRPDDDDWAIAETMQSAWVGYATDGVPIFAPGWSTYDASAPNIAIFDEPPTSATEIADGRCAQLVALALPGL